MTDIQLPSSITTITDRDCFLNRFLQEIWAFAISKGAEYIIFAQGCFAPPSDAIQLRCDAQRQQAHNIDIINQGQIHLATSPALLREARRLSESATPIKHPESAASISSHPPKHATSARGTGGVGGVRIDGEEVHDTSVQALSGALRASSVV